MALPAAAAVSAVPAALQLGFGIHQYIKGSKQLKGLDRPTQQVQKEYDQNVALSQDLYGAAKRQAHVGMGEQQKALAQDMALQAQSSGMNAVLQGGMGLRGLGQMQSNSADMMRSVLQMDIQQQMANQGNVYNQAGNLMTQRQLLAGEKQAAWQYNQADKYSEDLTAAQALMGAGQQNIMGGVQSGTEIGTAYLGASGG